MAQASWPTRRSEAGSHAASRMALAAPGSQVAHQARASARFLGLVSGLALFLQMAQLLLLDWHDMESTGQWAEHVPGMFKIC